MSRAGALGAPGRPPRAREGAEGKRWLLRRADGLLLGLAVGPVLGIVAMAALTGGLVRNLAWLGAGLVAGGLAGLWAGERLGFRERDGRRQQAVGNLWLLPWQRYGLHALLAAGLTVGTMFAVRAAAAGASQTSEAARSEAAPGS